MFDDPMMNALVLPYEILLGVCVILLLDWYGRRKDQREGYRDLRRLKGKVSFSTDLETLRDDGNDRR